MNTELEKCVSLYYDNPELGIFTAKSNGLLLELVTFITKHWCSSKHSHKSSIFRINYKGDCIIYSLQSNLYEIIYLRIISDNCFSSHDEIIYTGLSRYLKTKSEILEMFIPYVINHLNETYPDESTT